MAGRGSAIHVQTAKEANMRKRHLLLLFMAIVCCAILFTWRPVKTEEQAKKTAESFVSTIFRNRFSEYEASAYLEGSFWIVSYGIPPVCNENGEISGGTAGGGGPAVDFLGN